MRRSLCPLLVMCCSIVPSLSIAQDLFPTVLSFGLDAQQSKAQLAHQCDVLSTHTLPITWSMAAQSRVDLRCEGFFYWGKKRNLVLEFNDDQLDVVRVSGIRNVELEIANALVHTYGAPAVTTRYLSYFPTDAVALEPIRDQLSFASPRLKSRFAEYIQRVKDNPYNNQLSREQWLDDLQVLDSHIRNAHLDPFWRNPEKAYLKLFYEAQRYLMSDEHPDSDLINGYFEKLVAHLGDGHSYILNKTARYGSLPYRLDWFGDDLVITEVDQQYRDLLGAKIIAFDDMPLEQADLLLKPFVPVVNPSSFKDESKDSYQFFGLLKAAGIAKASNIELTLKTLQGKTIKQLLAVDAKVNQSTHWTSLYDLYGQTLPYYLRAHDYAQRLVYLAKENALYLHYAAVAENEKGDIGKLADDINHWIDTKHINKLIIDVRNNAGGDSYLNASLIHAIASNVNINQRGKLFVLTNHATFSAAINFVGNMAIKTRALFVGEQVRDSPVFIGESGPQALYELPNSHIAVSLSFSRWSTTYDDDNRKSLTLDLPVTEHIQNILQGQDATLQAALDYHGESRQPMRTDSAQARRWIGRYDYSADKSLIIKDDHGALMLEISELAFSNLYPANNIELTTDLPGVRLRLLPDGNLELLQPASSPRILKKLADEQLKPVELLVAGRFDEAKAAYLAVHTSNPNLLSIQGNSLGILATHLRARYKKQELFDELRSIAISLYGSPVMSWEDDQ